MSNHNPTATSAMPSAPERLVIATRESPLALWQAHHVQGRLSQVYRQTQVELARMTTRGDQILETPLYQAGGKGLFIKELEVALLEGRADLAVHSLKDVPMELEAPFALVAIGERELRRACQLRARRPDLVVETLRGNVGTRLRKLDAGEFDGILLAAAGLIRLELADRIREVIPPEVSLPAVGQGALGFEVRADRSDVAALLQVMNHEPTRQRVTAERAMSRALGGSCNVPLGCHAVLNGDRLHLTGFVAMPDGSRMIRGETEGLATDAEAIGLDLAEQLRGRGAGAVMAELADHLSKPAG
ncbi:MAG: hydroxymethylbilane synthase [Betaproteobacteria bacterium]|nr:hydroxymethylbilane synthase [Betaproteobacteria bacterium]